MLSTSPSFEGGCTGTIGVDMTQQLLLSGQQAPRKRLSDARLLAAINRTEKNLTTNVVSFLRKHGWFVQRHGNWGVGNQHSAGFPDLIAVRGHRIVFMELKTHKGVVRKEQWEWLTRLYETGKAEVYVMRPVDWEYLRDSFT